MYIFELPEVGEGVVEAEIVKWLIEEGDFVQADQAVCEVMTDKTTIEISSPKSGRIHKRFGSAGDIVEVHTPFLEIDVNVGSEEAKQSSASSSSDIPQSKQPEKPVVQNLPEDRDVRTSPSPRVEEHPKSKSTGKH